MSFPLSQMHRLVTLNPRAKENVMRAAAEFLTDKSFAKIRPPWLRNPLTNRCLEIDAWCEELQLACEFQGYQHTVFPNCFHKTYDEFERQQQRDKFKATTLKELGIRLLEVPHTVPVSAIPSYMAERLAQWNLLWPRDRHRDLSVLAEELDLKDLVNHLDHPTRRTPLVIDMSNRTPMFLMPGIEPWMTPRYTPESFDREWLQEHCGLIKCKQLNQGWTPPSPGSLPYFTEAQLVGLESTADDTPLSEAQRFPVECCV